MNKVNLQKLLHRFDGMQEEVLRIEADIIRFNKDVFEFRKIFNKALELNKPDKRRKI